MPLCRCTACTASPQLVHRFSHLRDLLPLCTMPIQHTEEDAVFAALADWVGDQAAILVDLGVWLAVLACSTCR